MNIAKKLIVLLALMLCLCPLQSEAWWWDDSETDNQIRDLQQKNDELSKQHKEDQRKIEDLESSQGVNEGFVVVFFLGGLLGGACLLYVGLSHRHN